MEVERASKVAKKKKFKNITFKGEAMTKIQVLFTSADKKKMETMEIKVLRIS